MSIPIIINDEQGDFIMLDQITRVINKGYITNVYIKVDPGVNAHVSFVTSPLHPSEIYERVAEALKKQNAL